MNPQELKTIMGSGLLSFPLTDFDGHGDFHKKGYEKRLEWLAPYGATALFAAGGTGEFFSLTHDEYSQVIKTAVDTCAGKVPILAGVGDIELMVSIWRRLGDRFSYLGGLPTAEVYAAAYKALGVPVYSSAVFNFIPKTAMEFYRAIAADDHATTGRLIDEFFLPYLAIRNRRAGYAVSIVKAGAKLVGRGAGPVRAPLTDLTDDELTQLDALIRKLGAQ